MPGRRARTTVPIAVVGAHLGGLPLNAQLVERGADFAPATRTAPRYRLYALPGTTPPKPGLLRVADGGAAIEVEVWDDAAARGRPFLALIPAPLGIGTIELARRPPRARLPLRTACARGRRRHQRARRLARLPRRLASSAEAAHGADRSPNVFVNGTAMTAPLARCRSEPPPSPIGADARRHRRAAGTPSPRSACRASSARRGAEDSHRLLAGRGRAAVLRRGREGLLQGSRPRGRAAQVRRRAAGDGSDAVRPLGRQLQRHRLRQPRDRRDRAAGPVQDLRTNPSNAKYVLEEFIVPRTARSRRSPS